MADPADAPHAAHAAEVARRRARLDAVFGDVLPEQTRDDAAGEDDGGTPDAWLRREVPPHHGS